MTENIPDTRNPVPVDTSETPEPQGFLGGGDGGVAALKQKAEELGLDVEDAAPDDDTDLRDLRDTLLDSRSLAEMVKHLEKLRAISRDAAELGLTESVCQRLVKMGSYAERILTEL